MLSMDNFHVLQLLSIIFKLSQFFSTFLVIYVLIFEDYFVIDIN